jgi:hypothetical protein
MVRGSGPRDRSGGGGGGTASGGERRAGGGERDTGGGQPRSGVARRDDGERRGGDRTATTSERPADRGEGQRVAVPRYDRDNDRRRDNPRIVVRQRPDVNINIGNTFRGPRYYSPSYYDRWARSYYHWSPVRYAPWSLIYGSIGFSNFGYYGSLGSPYPVYSNYAYGPYSPRHASGYDLGGVRLKIRPRDAQVFVDGHYAGLVDDFDGMFQQLRLESGGHKIEIHMPGYEDLELDVHVQPGRTVTLEEIMRPRP